MKKMYKRVLALVLVLALTFSCTAFASAATPENVTPELTFEVTSEDGVMPLATQQLTDVISGTAPSYYVTFDLPSRAYVTIVISTDCRSPIDMYFYGPTWDSRQFTVSNSNQRYFSSTKMLDAGHYGCTVNIPGGAKTAFALAATDYKYDG